MAFKRRKKLITSQQIEYVDYKILSFLAVSFQNVGKSFSSLTGASAKNQRKSNNSYQTRSRNQTMPFVNELRKRPLRVFFSSPVDLFFWAWNKKAE